MNSGWAAVLVTAIIQAGGILYYAGWAGRDRKAQKETLREHTRKICDLEAYKSVQEQVCAATHGRPVSLGAVGRQSEK